MLLQQNQRSFLGTSVEKQENLSFLSKLCCWNTLLLYVGWNTKTIRKKKKSHSAHTHTLTGGKKWSMKRVSMVLIFFFMSFLALIISFLDFKIKMTLPIPPPPPKKKKNNYANLFQHHEVCIVFHKLYAHTNHIIVRLKRYQQRMKLLFTNLVFDIFTKNCVCKIIGKNSTILHVFNARIIQFVHE